MESGDNAIRLDRENEVYEYVLVALPCDEVSEKVNEERAGFCEAYGHNPCLQVKPHIALATYLSKERMEERLERWIQNICNLQNSFTVTLNNYSSFPPHTIYLRVQEKEPFARLANALRILNGFMEMNDCPSIEFIAKPHMTIAGQLPPSIYEKAISEYAQKSFYESFKVGRLALLKRDAYMRCQLINTFILPSAVCE
jgi:2'-5' RNA ligase